MSPVNVGQLCSVEGCEKPAASKGYCNSHYGKLHRYGDPLRGRAPSNVGKTCSVEGCNRPARVRGWCSAHYSRWQNYGDPEVGGPLKTVRKITTRQVCAWPEGCKELERAHGFCAKHYNRARHSRDLEHLLPEHGRAERCIAPECQDPQYAKGFCHSHYEKMRRGQNPLREADVEPEEPIDYETFGGRLYALRVSRGWTLQDAGERVGVSGERIRQLEKLASPPQVNTIARLAQAFEVDATTLIGNQIPSGVGSEVKEARQTVAKNLHMTCLWCGGSGSLAPVGMSADSAQWRTTCAYCKGSGAIYISPAPALSQDKEEEGD